jgi:tetratricopeptide (TPR) repeat protein
MLRPPTLPVLAVSIGLTVAAWPGFAADQATRDEIARLFNQRQWAEAQVLLEKVVAVEPNNAEAWSSLGQTFIARSDAEKAVAAYEKATAIEPTNSNYFLQLGHAHGVSAVKAGLFAKMGFARKCKAAYDKAVELDPKNINARWSLMEYCRQAPSFIGGGMELAYAQAAEIKQLDARRGRAAYASLYSAEKKFPEAFALYEQVLQEKPDDEDALFSIGRLAARSGQQLDRGLAALKQLATRPDRARDPRLPAFIGNILEKLGDKPGAQAAYEAALAIDPGFTQALEPLRKLKEG